MKIAFYSDNFYPELSGIADSVIALGSALVENGHQVLYVGPQYSKRDYLAIGRNYRDSFEDGKSFYEYRLPSLPLLGSPTGHSRIAIPFGFDFMKLKKFAPDIIHTNSPFGTGFEALLISKLLNVPLVGTNHTPASEYVNKSLPFSNSLKILSLKFYCGYYNRCDYVTTPCASLLAEMQKFGLHTETRVLSNPIELSNFHPVKDSTEKQEMKNMFGFSGRTILFTGRLAEEKHVDVIIKAFKKVSDEIPDVELAIAGHGNAEILLRDLVNKLDLEKRVKLLGYVKKSDLPALYKASDLFIIMSTAETQSLGLFQAMSTGLPVIGANSRALPEYIKEENGIIVEPGDVISLAREIIKILNDKSLAQGLGQGGIKMSEIAHPNMVAKEWEQIYLDLVSSKQWKKN